MKLKILIPAMLGAAALVPAASAGFTQPAPVQVDFNGAGGGSALGDIVTARDDKADNVFIGCGTRSFDFGGGGTFEQAFCQAADAEGDQATCFTENPTLIDAAQSVSDTSFITFSWTDDGTGSLTCTRIGASTQSFYQDKHTMGNTQGNNK